MKKTELTNCPQWLLDADTLNEDVEIVNNQLVWRDGVWNRGVWRDGEWRGGVWRGGVWHRGVWHGGEWLGGVWRGGVWRGGEWHRGVWRGGEWLGGVWRGGESAIKLRWPILVDMQGKIKIGCKLKSVQEWDDFFNSDEEFETPRNTDAFKLIHGAFEAYKAYLYFMAK